MADTGFISAAIYEQFLMSRATVITEDLKKDPLTVNKFVQQTLPCLELEELSVESECPCAPPSGCTWFRTTLPIPTPLVELISVTGIGGNLSELIHYTYRDWEKVKFSLQSRIPAERNRAYYTIRNNYLYLLGNTHVKSVAISGVFYDPVETQRHPLCGEVFSDCKPFLDYPLYVDPSRYQQMLLLTFQSIGGMRSTAAFDSTNNTQPPTTIEPTR